MCTNRERKSNKRLKLEYEELLIELSQRRKRKPMLGMMIQLDGSPHDWFEGEAGLTGCGSEGSKEELFTLL